MSHRWRWIVAVAAPGALAFFLGSCVDEKIVYRDGPNFVTPPSNAASFVGYSDKATKRTVCGSCHIGQQRRWEGTAHADAMATLQASGHAQGACERCHTVNNQGNAVTDTTAGWRSTKDDRYHDVQCESCHGPGLDHVTSPQRGQMLASIHADTGAGVANGCAECHSGSHHPFVDEWRKSRHSTSHTRAYSAGAPNAACQGCHIGQAVLANWGVNTNYTEKSLGQTVATGEGVTCAVCHDPHARDNPNQLRFPVDSRDPENNLCARCHSRRSNPDFAGNRDSPHAPHGPLVFGTAGWFPPGIEFEEAESSHGSDRNPKLCAGCHVQNYTVTDKLTNEFQVEVVGHRFLAIPCVDANGAPTDSQSCQVSQRSFKSCAGSGCHTSETSARLAFAGAEDDIALLVGLLNNMLAQVPASEKLPAAAGKVTVARGAAFNAALATTPGAVAHNAFLVEALLRASIAAVAQQYGIAPPPGLNLAPYDQKDLRMAPR